MAHRAPRLSALVVAGVLALGATASVSAAHVTTLGTALTGAEEVPGPGDPNGKGSITLDVFASGTICWDAKIQGIDGIAAAHIHEADAGMAGPVVVDLRPDMATTRGNTLAWCVTTTPAQAAEIIASPSDYYVNVHNATYPAGALRGQLGD